jgi:hypothetical protein
MPNVTAIGDRYGVNRNTITGKAKVIEPGHDTPLLKLVAYNSWRYDYEGEVFEVLQKFFPPPIRSEMKKD